MTQIGKYPDTMHRVCVKAVIRNNKNKVLCLKENTIFWDLPGGGVGHGETLDQALTRELLEEISYQGKFESMIIDNVIAYHKPSERCYLFIVTT